MSERMPMLLTESLDVTRREQTHEHIESCDLCSAEWAAYRETWAVMGDLSEVDVPARVKAQFLERIGVAVPAPRNVVPFRSRPAFKWVAQAAAVAVLVGGSYVAGNRNAETTILPSEARIDSITPVQRLSTGGLTPLAIAETRVVDASAISPVIEGRPNIANVQFVDSDASDDDIEVSFDITSRWTVTGNPKDKSMVRLLSYMLENEDAVTPRSGALEWVRRTYSDPANADPEIANALSKVLRNDSHEGVRIRAVETMTNLPATMAAETRDALISALKSDPNPAVRIKAVEALAAMARGGAVFDTDMVDTLRQKVAQDDENAYVRVKAAEVLSSIKP